MLCGANAAGGVSQRLPRPAQRLAAPRAAAARASVRSVAARAARGGGDGGVTERPKDVGVVERAGWDADKDSGGVATLARPESGDGAASGNKGSSGGNFRLLLIDAPAHTERRVVAGICGVVAGVDEARAKNVYDTSKQLGMAIVVSCLKEHAEFYRQQLYLHGLKTAIEPDTFTA
ncbi:MAG: hypothetical protein J3K34DRAFT_410450 [Monoraphidium minutum]|nr:MAG: hypothetical protein J3K34DRAFT_410450 [Monoraphidium minutum]